MILVPQNGGDGDRSSAVEAMQVAAAQRAGGDTDEDLAGTKRWDQDSAMLQRTARAREDRDGGGGHAAASKRRAERRPK